MCINKYIVQILRNKPNMYVAVCQYIYIYIMCTYICIYICVCDYIACMYSTNGV